MERAVLKINFGWKSKTSVFIGLILLIGTFQQLSCASSDNASMDAGSNEDTSDEVVISVDFYSLCSDLSCDDFGLVTGELEWGVPTWHKHDSGLGLLGERVIVRTTDDTAGDLTISALCYDIRYMGHWDSNVQMFLDIAITRNDSDDIPVTETIEMKEKDWSVAGLTIRAPSAPGEISFDIRKEGEGEAVLYFFEVDGVFYCEDHAVEVDV